MAATSVASLRTAAILALRKKDKKKKKSSAVASAPAGRVKSASPATSSVGGATRKTIGLPVGSVSAPSRRRRSRLTGQARATEVTGREKGTFGRSVFPGVTSRAEVGILPRRRRKRS